jgi:hypothetical protein
MKWNNHKELEGKHAFLGASNYHWLNWDDSIFEVRYYSQFAQIIGTTIHELAHKCIMNRIKINKHDIHMVQLALDEAFVPRDAYDPGDILDTLIPFVNDAIGFHMSSEIILYYNQYLFGTTDAIVYNEKDRLLRIHDLKTGTTPARMEQLYIYAAFFCLEYKIDPLKIKYETRLYQGLDVLIDTPDPDIIYQITELMKKRSAQILGYLEREGK